MTLRDRIENKLTVWLLGTLLTGFLAGIATYRTVLEMAQLKTISSAEYQQLTETKKPEETDSAAATRSLYLAAGSIVHFADYGFAIEIAGYSPNYTPKTKGIDVLIYYLRDKSQRVTDENKSSPTGPHIPRDHFVFQPDTPQRVRLPSGTFQIILQDPQISNQPNYVDGAQMQLTKEGA